MCLWLKNRADPESREIREHWGGPGGKRLRDEANSHAMGDERIPGESEFVTEVLSQTNEGYERGYELKVNGYDLDRNAERVAEVPCTTKEEVFELPLFLGCQGFGPLAKGIVKTIGTKQLGRGIRFGT